jgi:hypothetical protein
MSEFNSDDYLEQRQKKSKVVANFSQVKALLVLAVVGIFVYIAWYAYTSTGNVEDSSLPVIPASSEIIKSKPENPGGLVVANRDKGIFEGMSNIPAKKIKTEKPVTPPEAPVSKQVVVEKIEKTLPVVPEKEVVDNSVPVHDFIVSKNGEKSAPTTEPEIVPETIAVSSSTPSEVVAPEQTMVKAAPEPSELDSELDKELDNIKPNSVNVQKTENIVQPHSGGLKLPEIYTVRIAALKTEHATVEAWKSLKSTYSDLLGNLDSEVQISEKDGKEVYYLHAGPISSRARAEQICKSLQERGRRCRVY